MNLWFNSWKDDRYKLQVFFMLFAFMSLILFDIKHWIFYYLSATSLGFGFWFIFGKDANLQKDGMEKKK